ncbi:MAG: type I phosphomannose isomerase catalytic subunit [Ekhidna sp.]
MSELYPLKFKTIFKEKLWGGQKIKTILGKDFGELENCGETWELSGVPGNISVVANGALSGKMLSDIVAEHKHELVGGKIYKTYGGEFPLLIKFLDADQDLSVQVHPNDDLARKRHNCPGKAEMWYVVQADSGSTLINGFARDTNKVEYLDYFQSGRILELLNSEEVGKGDVYYLPAGRVHTIGKGLFIAEIQQTSDITYRIYDFDRVDKEGNKRELHTGLALDALDYSKPDRIRSNYDEIPNETNSIVSSPYFNTNKLVIEKNMSLDREDLDCFKIYIGVGGTGKIAGEAIHLGEVILIPATMKSYQIEPEDKLELLETYIEV